MIDVIIPTKTDYLFDRLMSSMLAMNPRSFVDTTVGVSPARIVVGNNGLSYDCVKTYWYSTAFVPIKNPFIFSRAINLCVESTRSEADLLILNDDTEVMSRNFFESIDEVLANPQYKQFGIVSLRLTGSGAGNPDQSRSVGVAEVVETRNVVCFVAAVIRREVWNAVGKMDERFTGYGFDDTDYCRRVVEAGWKLGVTGAGVVRHDSGGTYRPMYGEQKHTEMFLAARSLFIKKWGRGPQLGAYGGPKC